MKSALAFSIIFCASAVAERTVLDNGTGSVQLPPGYVSVYKPGGILRPAEATNAVFTKGEKGEGRIDFGTDGQGRLAEQAEKYFPQNYSILSKWTSEINGHRVSVLVKKEKDKPNQGGAIVSYTDLKVDFACDYANDGHLTDFLFVALSYKPAESVAPSDGDKRPK